MKLIVINIDDPGTDGIAPGCRELGRLENARPIIPHDTQ